MDSCARLSADFPLSAFGQTKRPANRHSPSPSHHRTLIRSPRRPRNTNTCPQNGSCSSFIWTAAIQIWAPVGTVITPADSSTRRANNPDPRRHQCAAGLVAVAAGSSPAIRRMELPSASEPGQRAHLKSSPAAVQRLVLWLPHITDDPLAHDKSRRPRPDGYALRKYWNVSNEII